MSLWKCVYNTLGNLAQEKVKLIFVSLELQSQQPDLVVHVKKSESVSLSVVSSSL